MDRVINIKVGGNHLSKDNKNAGVKGEANVTNLRITFDESWKGYAKTVTFFDAHGNNPVKRIETTDLIEDITKDTLTYITPIPKEPLAIAGEMTFVIDGYKDGKRMRSISDTLVVKDAPMTDNAGEPTDPTPTQAEQIQKQYDNIINTIQNAAISEQNAKASEELALSYKNLTEKYADECEEHSETVKEATKKAPYVGDNGNWIAWDSEKKEFGDTGVKAQAGSTVYVGDNPPEEADVWVDTNGSSVKYYTAEEIDRLLGKFIQISASITLYADRWEKGASETMWKQEVVVENATVTEYSKIDLQPTPEQLAIFHEKDIAFVTENEDTKVTVFCIGQKPTNDYTIQATVSEVEINA